MQNFAQQVANRSFLGLIRSPSFGYRDRICINWWRINRN